MIFFLNISHSLTPQYHHILYIIRRTRRRNHTNLSLLNQWKRSTKKLRLSRWEAKQLDTRLSLPSSVCVTRKEKKDHFVLWVYWVRTSHIIFKQKSGFVFSCIDTSFKHIVSESFDFCGCTSTPHILPWRFTLRTTVTVYRVWSVLVLLYQKI